jgi:phosphatidylcholine synthase
VALLVDAVDGPLARRCDVKGALPRWSGDTLDLVVDFVTYVFVPAYAIASGGLLPEGVAAIGGVAIVVTSGLYFADREMKTADNYFRGFPAVWNLAAFYLLLLRPTAWLAAIVVAALCVLTFVPFAFVHPLRIVRFRVFNMALVAIWAALACIAVIDDLSPGLTVTAALCAIAVYFFAAGVFRRAP